MTHEGITVGLAEATEAEFKPILGGLRAFNRSVLGEFEQHQLVIAAKDASGTTVGGAFGGVHLGWLKVDVLWVDEAWRGKGLGRAILTEMEREGMERGARRSMLDTFQFQAPLFYQRCGYVEFGRVRDFAQGHDRIYLEKPLTPGQP